MKQLFLSSVKSLRFRLILLVLLAVIPALGINFYSGVEQRKMAREKAVDDAYRFTRLVSYNYSSLISNTQQLLAFLSIEESLQDPQVCNQYLQRLETIYPIYGAFSIASLDGSIVCSSIDLDNPVSISDRTYFQQALKSGEFSIGEPLVDRLTHKMIVPLAAPIFNLEQKTSGVITASLDVNQVLNYATEMNLPPDSAILVIDKQGTVVFRYPGTASWAGQRMPDTPVIEDILKNQGEGSTEAKGVDGVLRLYAFTPTELSTENNIFISVGIPSTIAYAQVQQLLRINTIGISISALLAMLAAWFFGDILFLRIVSLTAERDFAENQLREANTQLESRVSERTAQLGLANEQLQVELVERQRVVETLRQRETELNKLLNLLKQSNRDLQDFAYIASHDLQEPLRKIQAFGDRLLKHNHENLGEEGNVYAERMISSANRMQVMVNDLLAYSRVSTKGNEFRSVDLNVILKEILYDLEIRIEETNGQVIADDLPTLEADPLQMRQLLQNLIANALKFHQPNVPPIIKVCEDHTAAKDKPQDGSITIIVEDNGIGFDVKYLDRIFQPFQRLHSRTDFEGSGIGLAICRKIVERHNGSITATSELNQGSRFSVTLPKKQPLEI